jgi:CRISPR/Cas system-associated exonuclease Cas4 (RecB family)
MMARVPDKEEALEDYSRIWKEKWKPSVTVVKQGYTPDHYREVGRRCVDDYYDEQYPFDKEGRVRGVEEHLVFSLDGAGRYKMQGYPDLLLEKRKNEFAIHDHKTGRMPTREQAEEDRQLPLYHVGVEQRYPDVQVKELVWHYLAKGRVIRLPATKKRMEGAKKWAISVIRQIERRIERQEAFEPRETALCNWCEFQPVCPAKNPALPKVTPKRREALTEGAALVDKWEKLEAQKKILENEIEEAKERLRELAESCELDSFEGAAKAALVRYEECLAAPRIDSGNRAPLEELLRREGLWDEFSELKLSALNHAYRGGHFDDRLQRRIEKLLDRRRDWKVSLKKKG